MSIAQITKRFQVTLTTQSPVISRNKLCKEIPEEWLRRERYGLVEEQPSRPKEHGIRVPRRGAVEQGVACVEGSSGGGIIGGEQRVEGSKHVRSEGRVVKEELTEEGVECLLLRHSRVRRLGTSLEGYRQIRDRP